MVISSKQSGVETILILTLSVLCWTCWLWSWVGWERPQPPPSCWAVSWNSDPLPLLTPLRGRGALGQRGRASPLPHWKRSPDPCTWSWCPLRSLTLALHRSPVWGKTLLYTTFHSMMNAKLSKHGSGTVVTTGLIKTIQTAPHKLFVSSKLASLYCD